MQVYKQCPIRFAVLYCPAFAFHSIRQRIERTNSIALNDYIFVSLVVLNMLFFPPQDAALENHAEWNEPKENIFLRNFPLHQTCRDGDVTKLAGLLKHVSDGSPYRTPFGSAMSLNLSSEDPFYGWMPAHWAAYFGKLDCLSLVIQTSRHVDVPSLKLLQTPTHMAAYAGNVFCLQWLLDHGSDPLRWDYMKETPLHKAARTGSLEAISLLITSGAKLLWKNVCGQTAADVAISSGHNEAALYLNQQAQDMHYSAGNKSVAGLKGGNFVSASNGYYGHHQTAAHEDFQDVLLCSAINLNAGSVGGRKRTRETYECEQSNKKRRFVQEQCSEDTKDEDTEMAYEHSNASVLASRCVLPCYY